MTTARIDPHKTDATQLIALLLACFSICFEVPQDMMEENVKKCEFALKQYKVCSDSGEWPNKEPVIQKLQYPGWYRSPLPEEQPAILEEPTESLEDIF